MSHNLRLISVQTPWRSPIGGDTSASKLESWTRKTKYSKSRPAPHPRKRGNQKKTGCNSGNGETNQYNEASRKRHGNAEKNPNTTILIRRHEDIGENDSLDILICFKDILCKFVFVPLVAHTYHKHNIKIPLG